LVERAVVYAIVEEILNVIDHNAKNACRVTSYRRVNGPVPNVMITVVNTMKFKVRIVRDV
jgi:hypothetical protein